MPPGLYRNMKGQVFMEALFVIPVLFMLFIFIVEMGFLMFNWAVINFYTCSTVVAASTRGQFSDEIRIRLAQNISDWTVGGRGYGYDLAGTAPPEAPDKDIVYIYGTDRNTRVQRGSYINIGVGYPWRFKFFIIDNLARFAVREDRLRLKVSASAPSEVFIE